MKKRKKLTTHFALLVAMICLSGCGEQFLDIQPESVADVEDVYQSQKDFEQALIGVYNELQSEGQYGEAFQALIETRADNLKETTAGFQDGIFFQIDRFLVRADNPVLDDAWNSIYKAIYRANLILEKLPDAGLTQEVAQAIAAEARALRALNYFNAVRIWGEIPLLTSTQSPDQAIEATRASLVQLYNLIEQDLQNAAQVLPANYPDENLGRMTKYAATGLLAKVYLTQQKYQETADVLKPLMDQGIYVLLPNYEEVFNISNELNPEILFAVRYKRLVAEVNMFFSRAGNALTVSDSLAALYGPGDQRADLNQMTTVGSYLLPAKFSSGGASDRKTGLDYPLLRYADVLLMYAEARNELSYQGNGPAMNALNQVRTRAGMAPYTQERLPSQEAFRQAVWLERRLELAFEMHRWFDLVRTNQAQTAMQADNLSIDDYQLRYPIPQSEIDRIQNPGFVQNPGY